MGLQWVEAMFESVVTFMRCGVRFPAGEQFRVFGRFDNQTLWRTAVKSSAFNLENIFKL